MLLYEDARTGSIVSRLVAIGNLARRLTIVVCVLLLGALFTAFGTILLGDFWWLATALGTAIGWWLGAFVASLFVAVVEWMAQMLVAQGEIVATLRKMR